MMCEQAELRMAELLAGEISTEDRAGLEKHLLDCGACRGDYELARAGVRIEWGDVSVPKEVIDATLASFREPAPVVRMLRWATAAAAVFGVAVLLLTSSRAPNAPSAKAPEIPVRRPEMLAMMQDAVVGALVCKDEDGRPVGELGLKSHEVTVEILDGIAKTTVEENFENHTGRRLEGTFNFPLPSDASISRLALEVNGKIEEGTCLERERAREVFESIVRRMQDPALLEWQPGGFFKCRVFPIEPHATKRVIVAYTQALPCFQGRMTYVYPLASEKTRTHPPEEVKIALQARFSGALSRIESPSHRLDVQRKNANEASMSFQAAHYRPNNDFVVTLEPGEEEVRVVSHKSDGEDGYFACFATPRGGGERMPGNYAFVLDASASISAPRLEVAKRLVRAMLERRIAGDRFEIFAHNVDVERSGEVDLRTANNFMDRIRPIGGSDVLRALLAAGDAEVIYIGKGAPSFGESDTARILEAVKGRRIRTIAVGSDANGLLLEKLGGMMRVNPNDDVNKRVAEIAATLGSPVLGDLKVDGGDAVYDVVGVRDLFYGERLVVSGRYRGAAAKLAITGLGYRREVDVSFPLKEEGNNYVRRLWAQRKVADLLAAGASKKPEVTELGVKYQIMTPYTSFLVLENEQMWKDHQLKREVQKQDQVLSEGDKTRSLLEDGTDLYKQGKYAEASAKFEEAFQMKPSSDQVYAFIKRAGEDMIGRMMNDPERKVQDIGRRLMELAKPGEPARERKVALTSPKTPVAPPPPATPSVPKPETTVEPPRPVVVVAKEEPPAPVVQPTPVSRPTVVPAPSPAKPEEPRSGKSTEIPDSEEVELPKAPSIRDPFEKRVTRDGSVIESRRKRVIEEQSVNSYYLEDPTTASGKLRTLSSADSDFRANDRDWNHVNDFWTANVSGLYAMTSAAERSEALKQIELSLASSDGSLDWAGIPHVHFTLDHDANGHQVDALDIGVMKPTVRNQPGVDFFAPTLKVKQQVLGDQGGEGQSREREVFTADDPEAAILGKAPRISGIPRDVDGGVAPGGTESGRIGEIVRLNQGLNSIQKTLAARNGKLEEGQYEADMQVFVRQLEVQLAQIQELTTKVDEHRAKLAKSLSEKSLGTAELQYSRQKAERLQQDLGELEAKHIEMAREKKHLEEKLNAIAQAGGNVNVAPKKALEAKVTAMATETGLVVISIGKDDGVLEGDEFTVYRGGEFVAKVVVDRSDRKWAAGKMVLKKSEPRVGDDVSNHIFVGPRVPPSELAMDVQAATEDGGWIALRTWVSGVGPLQIYAVTRAGKFVALIRVSRVSESRVEAQVAQGLAVGRLLPGDRAQYVEDARVYLAALPAEVRAELASRTSQQNIRAKMGMKE
jgi:hypothetical protein